MISPNRVANLVVLRFFKLDLCLHRGCPYILDVFARHFIATSDPIQGCHWHAFIHCEQRTPLIANKDGKIESDSRSQVYFSLILTHFMSQKIIPPSLASVEVAHAAHIARHPSNDVGCDASTMLDTMQLWSFSMQRCYFTCRLLSDCRVSGFAKWTCCE